MKTLLVTSAIAIGVPLLVGIVFTVFGALLKELLPSRPRFLRRRGSGDGIVTWMDRSSASGSVSVESGSHHHGGDFGGGGSSGHW